MFNRKQAGRLVEFDTKENLSRFNEDGYATTYLVGCYNPEFKIRVLRPKDVPMFSVRGGVDPSKRAWAQEEVF